MLQDDNPDQTIGSGAIAGPSRSRDPRATREPQVDSSGQTKQIPSYGLPFFEYRRSLFLAGQPIPTPPSPLPDTYTVPIDYPKPVPYTPRPCDPDSAIGRLETLLREPGAEETEKAWRSGVGGVHDHLTNKRRFTKPIRLGLVIKVLRAGWIKDGTWPIDPRTNRAIKPPSDSPSPEPLELAPENGTGQSQASLKVQKMDKDDGEWVDEMEAQASHQPK
ncbi:hypothetical protein DB88DRAFT_275956 [Papiliotrema laurentii]|uniref:DUF4050 domain-containing protein n=1 Tax=Papiliotrema laurentii TaxID=5418 RepID=A0AAD9FP79_PAPLA|nr:hypothetical protein DB88DRAFT_275956 [Papiliotrema laurentii]